MNYELVNVYNMGPLINLVSIHIREFWIFNYFVFKNSSNNASFFIIVSNLTDLFAHIRLVRVARLDKLSVTFVVLLKLILPVSTNTFSALNAGFVLDYNTGNNNLTLNYIVCKIWGFLFSLHAPCCVCFNDSFPWVSFHLCMN